MIVSWWLWYWVSWAVLGLEEFGWMEFGHWEVVWIPLFFFFFLFLGEGVERGVPITL